VFIRFLLVTLFVATMSGCATTHGKNNQDQLQSRLVELEKKLEEKDAEIVDLQYEVKDLSSKVGQSGGSQERTSESASIPASSGTKDDIIKVNVSASKIQTALKNAGHYTGKLDGKIGSGTKAAVVEFQKAQGLTADGVIGRKTWDALKKYL
jgi:murein L,D-transpeptidase YcbB/YkuD